MKLSIGQTRNPFAAFDLDNLASGAARLRPERLALTDSTGASLTYGELDARASTLAGHLAEFGLKAGECLLIVGTPHAAAIVALIACVRAGLDVAIAPPHLTAPEMTAFAAAAGAVALATHADYGDIAPLDECFQTAAALPAVRLIFSLGGGAADGAVDLDTAGLERRAAPARMRASGECRIIVREAAGVQRHDQGCIVTAALELMSRARIGMRAPIVSTLAPARFGALAAGPFAALLSGCSLHLHGPFEAARFIAEIDACAPVHLVGPRALADALARDNRLEPSTFASLMLTGCGLSGEAIAVDFAGAGNPVIDLDSIDRDALAPEPNAPMLQPERQASPAPAVMGVAKA